jgi:hypothetical protein
MESIQLGLFLALSFADIHSEGLTILGLKEANQSTCSNFSSGKLME